MKFNIGEYSSAEQIYCGGLSVLLVLIFVSIVTCVFTSTNHSLPEKSDPGWIKRRRVTISAPSNTVH